MTTERRRPGPRPRPPEQLRTVEVRHWLTPAEAAEIDAARGDVDRATWIREAALRAARRGRRP